MSINGRLAKLEKQVQIVEDEKRVQMAHAISVAVTRYRSGLLNAEDGAKVERILEIFSIAAERRAKHLQRL